MTQHLWQSVGPGGPLVEPGAEASTTPAAYEISGSYVDVAVLRLMIVTCISFKFQFFD